MVLVGERNVGHGAFGRVWVDEGAGVAFDEAVPLKVERDVLQSGNHVAVHALLTLALAAHGLQERRHGLLEGLNDVGFELRERILHGQQIMAVVVLFQHLSIQAVSNASLDDIRVIRGVHFTPRGRNCGGVLSEKLNVLLRSVSRLVDLFRSFGGALLQFLGLVLDFRVQSIEDRENLTFKAFLGFKM